MCAGTVAAPGAAISALAWSTIPRSMSVAVRATRSPFASTSTLLRIGMVLRRSTTLCTWPRDFSNAVRSIVSFMVFATPSQFLATASRMAGTGVPAAPVAAYFSLLECPEKPGRSARIMGPLQQVRDYIRTGGKQQPKAYKWPPGKAISAVPTGPSPVFSGPSWSLPPVGRRLVSMPACRPPVGPFRYAPNNSSDRPSGVQHPLQQVDILGKGAVGGAQLFDLLDRVHDRGVVAAAELAADLRQRAGGQLFGQEHGDLARAGDLAGAARRLHVGQLDVEMLGHPLLDFLDGDAAVVGAQQVAQQLLRGFQGHRMTNQGGVGGDAGQRAFQLAHVGRDAVGKELQLLVRNRHARLFGARLQDAQAQLVGGRVDVGDQTPAEAGAHALLQSFEVGRRLVGREHDLAVLVSEGVEGVEELFLG